MATRARGSAKGALLLVVVLVAAACGSRLSTDEIQAQNATRSAGGGAAAAGATSGSGADGVGSAAGASGSEAAGASGSGVGASGATASGGGATGGGATGRAATAAARKAPIVFGLIGYFSGLGGETLNPGRDAMVAWSKMVNARGGINGHPVQLLVGDDGGQGSRSVALAKDFVESKGAVALSFMSTSFDVGDYVKAKQIPMIGIILSDPSWSTNPYLFPPYGGDDSTPWGAARLMKRAGVKKVAELYCAEAANCKDSAPRWKYWVEAEGMQMAYQGSFAVSAPDYTAECLQMQRAGVEAVVPNGNVSAMVRLAQSCSRQNFHPTYVMATADDSITKIPDFEGAIAITPGFPWFVHSGSPAVNEYADAMRRYAPSRYEAGTAFVSWAWTSAKLFEAAAQHVSDKPTSQDILNGLWAMKGETLGGLLGGGLARTFNRGQPTPETYCIFDTRLVHGAWTAPQGLTPICR